jgi:chromosomal replication initiation ATPase DnaA
MLEKIIIEQTCIEFGITERQLTDKSRRSEIVDARQACAIVLREMEFTYQYIAELLGRKDHATIIHLLTTRRHNKHINERRANRILRVCKTLNSNEEARYKLNMKDFLEKVQHTK